MQRRRGAERILELITREKVTAVQRKRSPPVRAGSGRVRMVARQTRNKHFRFTHTHTNVHTNTRARWYACTLHTLTQNRHACMRLLALCLPACDPCVERGAVANNDQCSLYYALANCATHLASQNRTESLPCEHEDPSIDEFITAR